MSTDTLNNKINHDANHDTNQELDLNDDDLNYENTYRPWNNVVRGRSTCTANIYHIQEQLINENLQPINSKDVVKAVHKRNLLRQTKVIQISSNIKYISIQFGTSTLMETFCSKPLQIDEFSVQFLPDFRKKRRRYYEYTCISLLNVPSEAEEEAMTYYVKQFTTVIENPQYPVKIVQGIQYMTGTQIYPVHSLNQHTSRLISIF